MKLLKNLILFCVIILNYQSNILGQSPPIANGLIAYWPLNGDGLEYSGNGYDGVLYSPTGTADKNGNLNSALAFNGIDDYVLVNHQNELQVSDNRTYSFWVKMNELGTNIRILSKYKYFVSGFEIYINQSSVVYRSYKDGGSVNSSSNPVISVDEWYHVIVVINSGTPSFYINGINEDSNIQTDHQFIPSTQDLWIGSTTSYTLNGALDEILIYNRPLSTQEILYLSEYSSCVTWQCSNNGLFYSSGKVGIGTNLNSNPNDYTLAVNGTIGTKEITVEMTSSTWSDFVFNDNYNLRSLKEVESYISEKNHLPDIPTAKEVEDNGVNLGEMDAKLLQKIEELTLYIIEQNKRIEELENKLDKNGIQ